MDNEQKIQRAFEYAGYAGDGTREAHHKQWIIDQIIRALCGVPMEPKVVETQYGDYEYSVQGVNEEYTNFVGEDWDIGVPP